VGKVAGFILAQFAQQVAELGRGVVAQLGCLGGELWRLTLDVSFARLRWRRLPESKGVVRIIEKACGKRILSSAPRIAFEATDLRAWSTDLFNHTTRGLGSNMISAELLLSRSASWAPE
jgi:hypothetical protein